MLKMSTRSTYALKALAYMARRDMSQPTRLSAVAEDEKIPQPYLEQIFSKLKKAGVIQAVRGPEGGYRLNRPPEQISLADIVTVLEGPLEPALCSFPENRNDHCHESGDCLSRQICNELDGAIFKTLSNSTLGSLCGLKENVQ